MLVAAGGASLAGAALAAASVATAAPSTAIALRPAATAPATPAGRSGDGDAAPALRASSTGGIASPAPEPSPIGGRASASPEPAGTARVLPLDASALPDVTAVREAMREGRGRPLVRETRVVASADPRRAGSFTTYRDGANERTVDEFGPLRAERGRFGATAWHLNANGELIVDADAEARGAAPERPAERVEADAAAPQDVVLVETSPDGTVRRTSVERTSGHVVRIETDGPAERGVETFDDFRTTGTSTSAWHWTYRDEHPDDAAEFRIVRRDEGPVDPQDLAIPQSRPFVEFPKGVASVTLPATLHDGKFVVRITIEGRGLDFLLDSGASAIVMDDDVAKELELPTIGRRSNSANAASYVSSSTIAGEVRVGSLAMRDVAIQTIPHVGEAEAGIFKVVGLLGFDFLADAKLVLDYQNGTVTAYPRDAVLPPATGAGAFALPVRLGDQTPRVDVTVGGALGERFIVDTGANAGLMVFDYFARRHPEALAGADEAAAGERRFSGIGGDFAARPYRLHSVRLGSADFGDFVAYRVTSKAAYRGRDDGLIGADLLRFFTVTLDYPDGLIEFEPNALGLAGMAKE